MFKDIDPKILLACGGLLGGLLGFFGRALLGARRGIANADVEAAQQEEKAAGEGLDAAYLTPDPDDDVAARAKLEAARRLVRARLRTKAALDGIPEP